MAYLVAGCLFFLPVVGSEPAPPPFALLAVPAAARGHAADMATGAVLMLGRPFGDYTATDAHAAGVITLAGSELVMTVGHATRRDPGPRGGARPADSVLGGYNANLASLATKAAGRVRGSAPFGHDRVTDEARGRDQGEF